MKRMIALTMTTMMAVMVFTGCGGTQIQRAGQPAGRLRPY